MAKKQTYDLGDGGYTTPADESIAEALDRLARQDARLNPGGHFRTPGGADPVVATGSPISGPAAASGPATTSSRPVRDVGLTIVRWIIVLGAAWVAWRVFLR